jgi:membrane-associated phospholipid phosphatase
MTDLHEHSAVRLSPAGHQAEPVRARSRRPRRRFVVVATLAVLAVVVGALGPSAYATLTGGGSAKDRIAADPPPRLFPDGTIAPLGAQIDGQAATARRLMATWWSGHGTGPHDAAFAAWLQRSLPGPPRPSARAAELRQVQALAPTRTPAGVAAATWLETHGKKDIWKLYEHDQAEVVPASAGDRRKQQLKDMLKLSKTVADALGVRYQQSAPYVLDPSLRRDHTVTPGQVCPCSYPSRHAAAGAAARMFLSHFQPHMETQYRWMEDEIAYSRVYMAGHVPGDIRGGTLLGDLIGEYFLVTRGYQRAG